MRGAPRSNISRRSTALGQTVYEAALDRVRFIYDQCDDVLVAMSGGKDSTVLLHLATVVASERNRLPVKVYWLDQEAEWQGTVDFMREVFQRPTVRPYWFQVPFRLTNSLSGTSEWLHCWDPAARDKWIHPREPGSIHKFPLAMDRFHDIGTWMPTCCDTADKQHVGVLVGLRISESSQRRLSITLTESGDRHGAPKTRFKGITWSAKPTANTRKFWPIYDWEDQDVWVCIAQNHLAYNRVYDLFFQQGTAPQYMRISSLIHENSWAAILKLQAIEPETYDRFLNRIAGTSTFAHYSRNEIMPNELPAAFSTWGEYRDYLLEHLVEPHYQHHFRRRWQRGSQNRPDPRTGSMDRWHKVQVREIMINDWEGTLSDKARVRFMREDRDRSGHYLRRHAEERAHARPQPQPGEPGAMGAGGEGLRQRLQPEHGSPERDGATVPVDPA